jgi:hypothetical protein
MSDKRNRAKESREAMEVLREILRETPGNKRRRKALELAISILEARAFDGDCDE